MTASCCPARTAAPGRASRCVLRVCGCAGAISEPRQQLARTQSHLAEVPTHPPTLSPHKSISRSLARMYVLWALTATAPIVALHLMEPAQRTYKRRGRSGGGGLGPDPASPPKRPRPGPRLPVNVLCTSPPKMNTHMGHGVQQSHKSNLSALGLEGQYASNF